MSPRQKYINKLKKEISDRAGEQYKIKLEISQTPKSFIPVMNNRCQHNAVHAVKSGFAVTVIECVVIYTEGCVAHYVNLLEDGSIVDFTLGWSFSGSDYRLVRYVHENEYPDINNKLSDLKEKLCDGKIGKVCKILNIDKWDLC